MTAYYNENNPKAAAWLREVIKQGLIAPGDVDERDIQDVLPKELTGYTQCHFFAGIGGWSYALRLAGWPDDKPVWTASCPCQPFSAAGKRGGVADERHLWPATFWLADQLRPSTIFGEQVAGADGREWLAGVRIDLESVGYVVGAADLPAACVGAPQKRQRLFWVANTRHQHQGRPSAPREAESGRALGKPTGCGICSGMGHTSGSGLQERESDRGIQPDERQPQLQQAAQLSGDLGGMADSKKQRRREGSANAPGRTEGDGEERPGGGSADHGGINNPWTDSEWIYCGDGKWRRLKPGLKPVDHGLPARVGRLCGYGNAIVPQVAAKFITAFTEGEA